MVDKELMNESIAADLFTALDMVMEHLDDGSFGIIGNVPEWFVQFYPDVASKKDKLRLGKKLFSKTFCSTLKISG